MWCPWREGFPEYYGWKEGYPLGKEDSERDAPYNPDVETRCILRVSEEEFYAEDFRSRCERYAFGWKTGYADGYTVVAGRKILERKRNEEIAKAEEAAKRQDRKDFLLFCLKSVMLILLVLFSIYCPPLWEM